MTTPALTSLAPKLSKAGFGDYAIAGIIANLHDEESGGDPDAVGDGGTSFGLGQWHDDRARNLMAIPASWTKKPDTLVFLGNPNTCNDAGATGSGQTIKGATSGSLTFTSGTDAAAVTRTLIPDPDTTAFPNRWRIF